MKPRIRLGIHSRTNELYALSDEGICGPIPREEVIDPVGQARPDWWQRELEFDPSRLEWAGSQPWTIIGWTLVDNKRRTDLPIPEGTEASGLR
ncbi:MAG: hypothetical protein HY329_23900 [Chloroflexi bacterium]|nr:hypothetical protein [Chloroflexota bacterium]